MTAITEPTGERTLHRTIDWKKTFWIASGVPPLVLFSIGGIAATVGTPSYIVWTLSILMGFTQSFTYAEIAGMFPNKSGGAPIYGAAAWMRYGKIFGPLSVEDNLLLGAYRLLPRFFGFRSRAAGDLERVYTLFPRLRERRRQQAGTLSGGEQQMLAIGRALMARPKVMLLDEPSMGLAPVIVQEVFRTIQRLKQEGMTMLLVEQFAKAALAVADYAYVMERGRIAVERSPAELHKNERVIATFLG